jgi:predicted amidohydrolase
MREPLVIAVAQPPCTPYDIVVNAATHAATVRSVGARVVVFPELSLTGYELDAPAIDAGDLRLVPIVDACASAGSVAPRCGARRVDRTSRCWPSTAPG